MHKVTCLIDIQAPCQEVFNTVVNIDRRMQLSPLWGLNRLVEVDPNFPEPGSSYRIQVLTGTPIDLPQQGTDQDGHQKAVSGLSQALYLMLGHLETKDAVQAGSNEPVEAGIEEPDPEDIPPVEQEYIIAEYQPPHKFSYYLDESCETVVTWSFQSIPFGTRVNYEEVFCEETVEDDHFVSTVQHVIREWLNNIKRYSELRDSRGRRMVKWFLDRIYLKLRPDQRRAVLLSLYLQAIGLATFLVAAIGWGIVRLVL